MSDSTCNGHSVQSMTCSEATPKWCNVCRVWTGEAIAVMTFSLAAHVQRFGDNAIAAYDRVVAERDAARAEVARLGKLLQEAQRALVLAGGKGER